MLPFHISYIPVLGFYASFEMDFSSTLMCGFLGTQLSVAKVS